MLPWLAPIGGQVETKLGPPYHHVLKFYVVQFIC